MGSANAIASGTQSTALGQGSSAGFANSTAVGQGATTTRANQVAIGKANNTYTMSGIASAASLAAQTGSATTGRRRRRCAQGDEVGGQTKSRAHEQADHCWRHSPCCRREVSAIG